MFCSLAKVGLFTNVLPWLHSATLHSGKAIVVVCKSLLPSDDLLFLLQESVSLTHSSVAVWALGLCS